MIWLNVHATCFLFFLALGSCKAEVQETKTNAENVKICVVVRTYWEHGDAYSGSLRRLLRVFQAQTHQNWEALVVVRDSKPFWDLPYIVEDMDDDRVWIFANQVDANFTAKKEDSGAWNRKYHLDLYRVTDEAIFWGCPPESRWVLATNGDNEYMGDNVFDEIVKADGLGAEAVAFDFYARYQRLTAPSCARFNYTGEGSKCKDNLLRFCHTDLGANALLLPKLREEQISFSGVPTTNNPEMNDGYLAEILLISEWKVHHVRDQCLYSHSPNPMACALQSGVWDDRRVEGNDVAGACITKEDALRLVTKHGSDIQMVPITLFSNGNGFSGTSTESLVQIPCMRWNKPDTRFLEFGPICVAPQDEKTFPWKAYKYVRNLMEKKKELEAANQTSS